MISLPKPFSKLDETPFSLCRTMGSGLWSIYGF